MEIDMDAAENRLELATENAESLEAQMAAAVAALRRAKSDANEAVLGRVLEPLVENLMAQGALESFATLMKLCVLACRAVTHATRKLVYRFTLRAAEENCFLEKEVRRICVQFPHVNHLVVINPPGLVSLEAAPRNIRTLEVVMSTVPPVLEDLGVCSSLQVLNLRDFSTLRKISNLNLCSELCEIDLTGCCSLQPAVLTALESCTSLQKLHLQYPSSLTEFDSTGCAHLGEGAYLSLHFASRALTNIAQLARCPALRELHFMGCDALPAGEFHVLASCSGLKSLSVEGPSGIIYLPNLEACTNLASVHLIGCAAMADIETLPHCQALVSVELINCPALPNEAFRSLRHCTGLQRLSVGHCALMEGMPGLGNYPSLEVVSFLQDPHAAAPVSDISELLSCTSLRELTLGSLTLPNDEFKVLESCTSLQQLEIYVCSKLTECPNLGACPNLSLVKITACPMLASIAHLAACTSLQDLALQDNEHLPQDALKVLKSITRLKKLSLRCIKMKDCASLQGCTRLQVLRVGYTWHLACIAHLATCPSLQKLVIEQCDSLRNEAFSVLGKCSALQQLEISRCRQLQTVPSLRHCSSLTSVTFRDCITLKNITLLATCGSLREIAFLARNRVSVDTARDLRESCKWLKRFTLGESEL